MNNPMDADPQTPTSGLFLGSEPLEGVRHRYAAKGDDDKTDRSDGDTSDDDSTDTDKSDSDLTDKGDTRDDSRDTDRKD
jgi:hypothetical protein